MTDREMLAYIFGILRSPNLNVSGGYSYPKEYIQEILEKISNKLTNQSTGE